MRLLFICNQHQNRSKTAERLFKDKFETRSAGLYNEKPVTREQLNWADTIVVMEDEQRSEIGKRFPEIYIKKRIISFGILDIYNYNQSNLIDILKHKIKESL